MIDSNMRALFEKVEELKRENYVLLSSEVDYIISNDIADLNRIEHVLDMLIDCIYDEESRNKYIELCTYYCKINREKAKFYLKLLNKY